MERLQLRAYGQLEEAGGICGISLNALVAALANANRIPEAEEHLKRATELAARQGLPCLPARVMECLRNAGWRRVFRLNCELVTAEAVLATCSAHSAVRYRLRYVYEQEK